MKKSLIFIFPGQGSQKVGMGVDLYNNHHIAREVFDEVDDCLNQKLSKIIFDGPEESLKATSNAQPALMCVSIAIIKIIEHELKKDLSDFVQIVLGHSLGEYSSLCATKVLSLNATAKLLRIRGDAMQNAVRNIETKMVAVLGLEIKKIEDVINNTKFSKDSVCQIANDNCPGQVILSGTADAVDLVSSNLKNHGANSFINLNVSAPFHCSLMQPASEIMTEAIRATIFNQLSTKFISNVTAEFEVDIEKIKKLLVEQICSTVKWRESIMLADQNNAENIIEIGSGKVLSGINKRIGVKMKIENISRLEDIENFLKSNKDFL